ncbi:hypothetical protein Hanom_Chr12g01138831 [Helianthus anomalus]
MKENSVADELKTLEGFKRTPKDLVEEGSSSEPKSKHQKRLLRHYWSMNQRKKNQKLKLKEIMVIYLLNPQSY